MKAKKFKKGDTVWIWLDGAPYETVVQSNQYISYTTMYLVDCPPGWSKDSFIRAHGEGIFRSYNECAIEMLKTRIEVGEEPWWYYIYNGSQILEPILDQVMRP